MNLRLGAAGGGDYRWKSTAMIVAIESSALSGVEITSSPIGSWLNRLSVADTRLRTFVGQRQGLGHGDRYHHHLCGDRQSFPWNIAIQVGLMPDPGQRCPAPLWALFGTALRPILTAPRAVRAFNIVMALLLLASLYPVFMDA